MAGVHDVRLNNKPHMEHAFASAIIIQNIHFGNLSTYSPFLTFNKVNPYQEYVPSPADLQEIKYDYTVLIGRVIQNIPFFNLNFKNIIPDKISQPIYENLKLKSKVIPLAVLPKNEQKYQDVVGILDYYEEIVADVCEKASSSANIDDIKIHIGGDQLTRERFSGAKCLRAHHNSSKEKFNHLSPISFELFHLLMNYLTMFFKLLYSQDSVQDIGTLRSFQSRISRSNVGEDVKNHYEADKDFAVSVINVYIIECVLEYFGMKDIHSEPTKHIPPAFKDVSEKKEWFFKTIGDLISEFVFSSKQGVVEKKHIKVNGHPIKIKLSNGKEITLLKVKKSETEPDYVKNYGQLLLEIGLLFKDLLDFVKLPERQRGIRILKICMLYFKSFNNLSKYAFEILRLLVHQTCLLSEKEANEEFYGLFVNTNGHFDGHIPADLEMEHLVKKVKEHIKHMFSNKTEKNIICRTKSISIIKDIGENFDKATKVIVRAKKHSSKSAVADEQFMLKDLRKIRPFKFIGGRKHQSFPIVTPTVVQKLNTQHYFDWIETRSQKFVTEKGN